MKRLIIILAIIPFCLHSFSQIETKLQKANSLASKCLSSKADIYAECLGKANEMYNSAYIEYLTDSHSREKISDLDYARMMFHVGYYIYLNDNIYGNIPFYDSAMNVYAKFEKLNNDDVWRCFEMLEILYYHYYANSSDYEKSLNYALIQADFTKKYLNKQYHELASAMEAVSDAYARIKEFDNAENAIDEAITYAHKGNESGMYSTLQQKKDLITLAREYEIPETYCPAVSYLIENPTSRRDSLYNMLLDSYNVEEAMPLFEELQGMFEKDGMKSSDDSILYAKSLYHIAMQCWENAQSTDDDENATLMTARATRYMKLAEELYAPSKEAISEPHADILYMLGIIYYNGRNDRETAMKYVEASLDVFKVLPTNDYRFTRCMYLLDALDSYYCGDEMRDCEKAIRYNELMIGMSRGTDIDWYISALMQAGNNYTKIGNYNKALEYYMQAYENNDNPNGGDAEILLKLADTYKNLGDSKSEEKYRKMYEDAIVNEMPTDDDYYIPTSYMSISDFLTVAVDDDEVELLYDSSFRPTKGTHCDSLRYDAVCAVMKRGSTNPSERINNTRPIMIAFEDYFAKGNATHTDSIYYAYSLYNVGKYISDAAKGFKGMQMLLEAKEMFEALSLNETRNYANTLYLLAEYNVQDLKSTYTSETRDYYVGAYQIYDALPSNSFFNNRCMEILGNLLEYGEKNYDNKYSIEVLEEIESYIGRHSEWFDDGDLEYLDIEISLKKADLYYKLFDYGSSILCYKKALELMDKAGMKKTYRYCRTVHELADICRYNHDYADAKKYAKQYEKLSKKYNQEENDDNDFWVGEDTSDTDIYGMAEPSELERLYQYLYMIYSSVNSDNVNDSRPFAIETFVKIKDLLAREGFNASTDSTVYEYSLLHISFIEDLAEKYDSALDYLSELDRFLPQSNSISGDRYTEIHYYYLLTKALALTGKEENREALKNFDLILDYYKRLESKGEYFEINYTTMLYVANVYTSLHDYDKAFVYYDYLMSHFDESEISDNYFNTKMAMASTYADMGEYVSVIGCLEPEFKRFEYTVVDSDICAGICNLLGNAYVTVGNYDRAYRCYIMAQESIRVYKGVDTYAEVQTLNNLGNFCKKIGKYREAIDYYDDAIAMLYRQQVEDSTIYAQLYESKGIAYSKLGRNDEAMSLFNRSLTINKSGFGENSSQYANTLCNIALVCKSKGDYYKALANYSDALAIFRNIYDDKHPIYAEILNGIGDVHFAMGDYEKSAESYSEAMEISRKHLANDFSFLTSAEREMYWEKNKDMSQRILRCGSKLSGNGVISGGAYNAELITKGLLLTSDIEFSRSIYDSGDSELISDYANLISMKNKLGKAYEMPVEDRYIDCRELKEKINTAERELVAKVEKYGGFNASIGLTWKDVQSAMRKGDVAVEFTRFEVDSTETRYAALVLNKFMKSPIFVPLCAEKDLQRLLRTGVMPEKPSDDRGATVLRDKRMGVYTSTDLYNAIWKPLEKYFTLNARIYFAPTGLLHQVAIEYAMVNSTKSISDIYEIYRVSSTRFLAMDYSPRPFDEAVLYGGISYDSDTASMKRESERFGTRAASYNSFADISKDEERSSLIYLPGTKTEVESINSKLKAGKIKVDMHLGESANEESFKDLSGKKVSLLHIATHGFFVHADTILNSEQSLNLSGLLLAGANNIWTNRPVPEGVEDGVLTAKEISNMDLRNADMVVLSACQTGLGEITDEGVFGLQRGFKKAGVHTLIMSLWSVDDNATQLMMTEFYSNLMAGMSKREAFLKAQRTLKTTKGFENPRFWAAFIMLDGNEK